MEYIYIYIHIYCGAHIKMAEGSGQVARPCNSDFAVTMVD